MRVDCNILMYASIVAESVSWTLDGLYPGSLQGDSK